MDKLKIGLLGGTGVAGQNYVKLLQGHPWFEIVDIAASPRSAGKSYEEVVKQRWQMPIEIPEYLRNIKVRDVQDFEAIPKDLAFVFSAMDLDKKEQTAAVEMEYAKRGIPVISNSSANRWTPDVPMLVG